MSKIAIDARIINSSTGTYAVNLLDNLAKIDKKNKYVVIVPKKDVDFWHADNKNFEILGVDVPNYSLKEQIKFKKILDNLNADLVHFLMPQQPIFYNKKTITTFHDLTLVKFYNRDKNFFVFHLKQFIGKIIFKKAAKKSEKIICPSQFTKNELIKFAKISDEKVSVIYEATKQPNKNLEKISVPFKRFILYVGQQSSYKNLAIIGDALDKLKEKYPDLGLVLVGKENKASEINKKYFAARGYKNIYFTGFLKDAQRDFLYTKCDAYIFPSLSEGFGLPGLEAMSYNAPVLSSNFSCLPEIYDKAAHYFNPEDVNDIANKIDEILSDDELKNELIKNGQKRLKDFSWEKMARQTLKEYEKIIKK